MKTIYGNSFEWRFEFPEVLNDKGNFVGFDIIIGNPPYISNKEMHQKGMQQFINIYNKIYTSAKSGNYDIYIPFIERSLSLLKPNAEISFIIPNKFVIAKYSIALLNLINSNYLFKNFTDLSNITVFEEASVYPIIIRILNKLNDTKTGITEKINCLLNSEKKLVLEKSENWNFTNHSLEYDTNSINGQITKKIETVKTINKDLEFSPGINGFQFTNYGKCITEGKISSNSKRIVVTGTIDRFVILKTKTRYKGQDYLNPYIHYDKELISEGKWNLFSTPKIVVAGMTKKIEAAFDEKGDLAPGVSVYSIISEINTLKYVLGLINSKLINWYFNIRFQDKHLAGGYISINTTLLAKIPFIQSDNKNKDKIIAFVDEILQKKATDININTENIEKKIDQIVYKLYALSEEEIKEIENK